MRGPSQNDFSISVTPIVTKNMNIKKKLFTLLCYYVIILLLRLRDVLHE